MIQEVRLRTLPKTAAVKEELLQELAVEMGIGASDINDIAIVKRSIDARQRRVMVNLTVRVALDEDTTAVPARRDVTFKNVSNEKPVIIVGAGPAGLFAALKCMELGLRPIVLERGKEVDRRAIDLASISRSGILNPNSNYCFGEGGAGAFSDGKLFTRSKKRGNVGEILQLLVQFGASEKILVDAHPHIGSDKLPRVIKNIRESIRKHGGKVHFDACVVDILIDHDTVVGVKTEDGKEYHGPVILATGHSARDVYKLLALKKIDIEAKGIAIGVRLEHPQHLIDQIQYHCKEGRGAWLPAAEYSFVTQIKDRGVYSFCMCPGGVIVPAASAPGELVVNGMSASARAGRFGNSGMVVQILPGDFSEYSRFGALEMMELQCDLEHRFYEAAGRTFKAPAQRMLDFVEKRKSKSLPQSSYPAGLTNCALHDLLPPSIGDRLRDGFIDFGRKSKGFLTNEACMVGLESRTSSPVRVPRVKDTLEHTRFDGLYPCGEGAGFAGGIVSAAIDGQRCAEAIYRKLAQT